MQIGELARRSGVSIRMLRHYESLGLLAPARSAAGYRIYGSEAVDTVARILALNEAGVRLESLRSLLSCAPGSTPGFTPCEALRVRLTQTLGEIDARIALLERSREALLGLLGSPH